MDSNNTYKIYTATDIRRYLNGEMTATEMYAIEKQAMEDPMLADAIEGYETITPEIAKFDKDWLEKNLAIKEAKVIPINNSRKNKKFPWLKIAAAAMVVGIISLVVINTLGKKSNEENIVAASSGTNKETAATTPLQDSIAAKQNDSTTTTRNTSTTPNANITTAPTFVRPDDLKAYYNNKLETQNSTIVITPVPSTKFTVNEGESKTAGLEDRKKADSVSFKDDYLVKEKDKINAERKDIVTAAKPAPPAQQEVLVTGYDTKRREVQQQQKAIDNRNLTNSSGIVVNASPQSNFDNNSIANRNVQSRSQTQQLYYFNYKVTDPQGNQIPFTNITIPADQVVTYSRVDGRFGLFSTDSVLNVNLKAAGYNAKNFQLAASKEYRNITLAEAPMADAEEVVIGTANNELAKKSAKLTSVIEAAEPADGYNNYNTYLVNNININEKPKGEVVLSFEVAKDGVPTNVVVDKSLSYAADAEAVRLLTQGPKWKAKKRKANKGRIIIRF